MKLNIEQASQTIDLHFLGLQASRVEKNPGVGSYPPAFDTRHKNTWVIMFRNELFRASQNALPSSGDRWQHAVMEFMTRVREMGGSPFPSLDSNDVDNVRQNLTEYRSAVVGALDGLGLLPRTAVKNISRSVTLNANDTVTVTTEGELGMGGFDDVNDLILLLRSGDAFKHQGGSTYTNHVNSVVDITVGVGEIPTISYRVTFRRPTTYDVRKGTSFAKAMEKLWLEVVRSVRFNTIRNKKSLF